ncbi:putative spermidine/putrescine transport system ATP-binding protein [Bradyrhizobium sp. GM2.2]|jgi:putative spermidine/putrescine transport system ATP-binding protein|uniref:Spermidine/putrescine import ATP-binding protein PotA n=1 Tax=Bradyrhizobium canariense TaxID=255045 RepID=A0ABX3WVT9_9BRAD|nr:MULTISPECIES: ABC transporter ATP-binding protein [Bradyrhizobium]MCK1271104.1 ABC transporter ATP-binding protein [Bradyrhizobium sp. 84]MCK1309173.1 ABC transporter ATP-binding protein [Bradyrhizobium sp. 45]MCK1320973.1 ABC transporter ATP-binding protein [Bradyrhizobium sp. 156]MCK1375423.1 ABC transporter ATP-binding protein [Bradyrhizobium sp. 49]MCK1426779.1 ABC transporter ATP-binding protein [Bradyrhizobium sp. 87]
MEAGMVTPAPALVRFSGIQKTYDGEHLVVKNLDLDIRKGEFVTLLGPSGSGKTTTLMMLAGFEVPTHGEIFLADRPIKNVPAHKRDIGMVFQNYALFPHLTIAENIAFPLSVRNTNKAEAQDRVKAALRMIKMETLAQRRPGQLSGGQQQRVALARALVFNPQLVLMDEPLGALDKRLREQMQLEIKQLHETMGITVVYVTHDQSEALTMSDRIAVFNDGIVQQIDRPDALYEHPVNSFVAHFIGENNVLSGTVETVEKQYCRVVLAGGGAVTARAVNVSGAGASTSLSVRPERIAIIPDGISSDEPNRLPAKVQNTIYLGDHALAVLDVADNKEFMVKLQPGTHDSLRAGSLTAGSLRPGDDVFITFRPEDCLALDPV